VTSHGEDDSSTSEIVVVVRPTVDLDSVQVDGRPLFPGGSPQSADIRPGSEMVLFCKAYGIPTPDIVWLGNRISPTTGGRFTVTKQITGNNVTSQWQISTVQQSDSGAYGCIAQSEAGTVNDATFIMVSGQCLFFISCQR
jgi:hypothetical protein